jgi:hypothetical protein
MPDDNHLKYDVFLSHAHVDAEVVERLAAGLEDKEGLHVLLDKWVLIPGTHWQQEMAKGLEEARTCAVCIGRTTPAGWFREEIERALNRQTKDPGFRVIPVILPGGDSSVVDNFLELRTWVVFKNNLEEGDAFHLLTCGVRGVPPGRLPALPLNVDLDVAMTRDKLTRLRALRSERLIDDDIALEYQRRLLDQLMTGRG